MSSKRSVGLLIASLACSLIAIPAAAQTVGNRVTVRPGGSVVLMPGAWAINADCSFRPVDFNVVVKPRQGRVVPQAVATTVTPSRTTGLVAMRCAGRPTKGLRVTYHANRGASGSDEVVIHITGGANFRPKTARYVIAIQ